MNRVGDSGRSVARMGGVVVPMPVVEWKTVVQADNPTREATLGRLRELRKKKLVAAGVTVAHRQGQRLRGRSTFYSVLTALAARSRQEGRDHDAALLVDAASVLETQFSEQLKEFLSHHLLKELPEAPFFDQLTKATAQALAGWTGLPGGFLAAAEVSDIEADMAHLEGTSGRGEPVSVDLPRALLDLQSLTTGDLVWVSTRLHGAAALVEVLPAVRVWLEVEDPEAQSPLYMLSTLADVVSSGNSPSSSSSDGLTTDERMTLSAEFRATVGANLAEEDLAGLRQDAVAGLLPRRRLRPAG